MVILFLACLHVINRAGKMHVTAAHRHFPLEIGMQQSEDVALL